REHVRDRTVPELHRERLGPAERGGTEVVGLEVGVEAREQRGSGLVQQMAQLGGHPGRELLGERAALAREDGLEEVAQPLVERFAEARLRDRAGEVFARQQTRADRAADRRGQAGLVLGDRALEGPEPAAPQPGRLVRMKQHPDRDRVRDAARERTEQNGERELEHGRDHPWPRRTSPYTARPTPRSSTQPRTTNSATGAGPTASPAASSSGAPSARNSPSSAASGAAMRHTGPRTRVRPPCAAPSSSRAPSTTRSSGPAMTQSTSPASGAPVSTTCSSTPSVT